MNSNLHLFNLIRNHKWNSLINALNNDTSFDLNTKDSNGKYLLTYAVLYNKASIVKLLIDKGARYDIVDGLRRSIIYYAIELKYDNIVDILLECSMKSIGIMICNMRDANGNIPLHYAILANNKHAVDALLKYNSTIHICDNNGLNALHIAVKMNLFDIAKSLIQYMSNIDSKTNNGETALHIAINYQYNDIAKLLIDSNANVDIQEPLNEFTPLHYSVGWNNLTIAEYLIKHNANVNIQDIYGNVPLMYCIKEDHAECFDILIKTDNIDVNQWNIDGKIPLHEVFDLYGKSNKHYIDTLIINSNISIQDINGNTCLHHIIKHGLLKEYNDIIIKKKINIFAKNSDGVFVYDLIDKNEFDEFIDLVTHSYINWENNNTDKNNQTENNTSYFNKIKQYILHNIKLIQNGKFDHCSKSYPFNKSQCIKLNEINTVKYCTFTGTMLDIIIGLIFILKKHKNVYAPIDIEKKNKNVCDTYISIGGLDNNDCTLIHFEILWIGFKLITVDNFSEIFMKCKSKTSKFIIIPLGIELKCGSHSNYLIFDKRTNEIERFEPYGNSMPYGFNYNGALLDTILTEYFTNIDSDIKYIKPDKYLPKIGFQHFDSNEQNKYKICDPNGFCAMWCIWYTDQRITFDNLTRDKLVENLFDSLKMNNISFRNMIRNYSSNIIELRDSLLSKFNLDINDWIHDNYTHKQKKLLIDSLINEIKNINN